MAKRIVSVTADQAAAALANPPATEAKRAAYNPKRASAGPCPKNKNHANTRIYSVKGRVRYCVCDDCGENWKQDAEPADMLNEFALRLAESFDVAERIDEDGQNFVIFEDAALKDIATQLRRLAGE